MTPSKFIQNIVASSIVSWGKRALVVPMTLSLAGCMSVGGSSMLPPPADESYHLRPGDQVRIITYDESQLSNNFTIGDDGTVAFPLIGTIKASGLTTSQFASAIASSLEKGQIISQPSVSVQVAEYHPISVLGEVNKPGQYPYQPGMTMLDAVALAGGFTYRAVTSYASDMRSNGDESGNAVEGKILPESKLESGDVITIYERYF